MLKNQTDREKVLKQISSLDFALCNLFDLRVLPAQSIANATEMSKYKVLKILHELRDDGLVERASQGCPAQVSYGEITELICDAMPPLNGWALTAKGRETDVYKAVKDEFERGMEEWAKGCVGEEEDSNG